MERHDKPEIFEVAPVRRAPRIIAHRGASRIAPENTIPAFERALEIGVDGIELDVQLTSDKVPVVTHNDDLSALTRYRGYLHTTSFDTIRTLDAGSHLSTRFSGERIPTLVEVLELLAPHDITIVLDLKPQPGLRGSLAKLAGGITADFRMRGRVIFASGSLRILDQLRRSAPSTERALTIALPPFPFFPTLLFAKFEGLAALHPSIRALWPGLAAKMKRTGLEINAWTANSPEEFDSCAALELDGIFTDDPAGAKAHFSGRPDSGGGIDGKRGY